MIDPYATSRSVVTGAGAPMIVDLSDPRARDAHRTGGKASALAVARTEGLPTVPGFVLTTDAVAALDGGVRIDAVEGLREAYDGLVGDGGSLVVRSSSTVEDQATESLAGQFATVTDVVGWPAFLAAVEEVLASRARPGFRKAAEAPFAVLVQPFVDCASGGVLFGVEPVSGRSDRYRVAGVAGPPERLVSGEVTASEFVITTAGTPVTTAPVPGGARLNRADLRALAGLATEAGRIFGAPQDIEWAISTDRELFLLQSRPVTTAVAGVPAGPVLGMGPVAETFPERLGWLEIDVWVPPLREAVVTALSLAGVASRHELASSPVVTTVRGVVVVDLELFGEVPRPRKVGGRMAVKARRLRASWRVGRLSRALPQLDRDLLRRTDSLLGRVPPLDQLSDLQLLALVDRARDLLRSLHGHEILTSLLVDPSSPRLTASSVALRTLAHAREDGLSDDEILAHHPVVLSLVPPRIGTRAQLPRDVNPPRLPSQTASSRAAVLREALRLRVRWVQELTARAIDELACRLTEEDLLDRPGQVAELSLAELHQLVTGRASAATDVPALDPDVAGGPIDTRTHQLPARFRLGDRGIPIALDPEQLSSGTGAGGGRASGPVTFDPDEVMPGSVLVVRTLSPALAPVLPHLAGLVCETGSVLAHTAILAREAGVATVVGYGGAVDRFAEGEVVEVDGMSGMVRRLEEEAA